MNTTENNKLIAEFMGAVLLDGQYFFKSIVFKEGKNFFDLEGLKFHYDWNWLMEVTEKIETTSYAVPEKFQRGFMKNTTTTTGLINSSYDDRIEFLGWTSSAWLGVKTIWDSTNLGEDVARYKSKIEAHYNAVTQFIVWYNSAEKGK